MHRQIASRYGRQMSERHGKPPRGFGHYLRDMIYGALDGVITTLAVVAGTSGAHLDARIGIILGIANLAADGLSMGASNYLALKSELEQTGKSVADEMPWRHGFATFAAFVVVGTMPLLGYAVAWISPVSPFAAAVVLAAVTLAVVGGIRARYVRKPPWRSALEVLAIGAAASVTAYGLGAGLSHLAG